VSHWSRNSAGLSRWDRYYRIKVRALRSAGEIHPSTESLELKRQIVIFESREFEQQNLQKLNYARPSRETQRFGFGMCQLDTSIVFEMIRPRPCCKRTANPSTLEFRAGGRMGRQSRAATSGTTSAIIACGAISNKLHRVGFTTSLS